jgi:hypothetical protein
VVGIDLGTTNSAACYVDTSETPWQVRGFAVPQLVAPGVVESRPTLPSFHYQPAAGEFSAQAFKLPWNKGPSDHVVGFFARDHGTLVPGRLAVSAKSWLSHSGVDRTAPILPWHGAADVEKLSPVEVSGRYLSHLREAWDARFPAYPLARQDVVLTLPASFDEIARELTVRAAAQAGLAKVVLIEEPQAAFYAWIYKHSLDWHEIVSPGQKILVVDIGGGTSDFTLIRVRGEPDGKVRFHRVAVGEHLILGGDNLDLALAHHLEQRLTSGGKLDPRPWAVLVRTCRQVKETLLGRDAPERLTVNLPGGGSRLIGGGLHVEVTADEAREVLVEGFFPRVPLDARPASRRSGFQEFGLPYAADPAVTRYLAAFLTAHRHVALDEASLQEPPALSDSPRTPHAPREGRRHAERDEYKSQYDYDPARPDVVLFNGGVFESAVLQARLLEVIQSWFRGPGHKDWSPRVLDNDRLELAVARGAAYYGMVRRGQGVRIAAGLARTYYVGVESQPPAAVCLVPAGVEPGQSVDLTQRKIDLLVSQPVEFPLYVSSTRLTDRPGELVVWDREQMTPLPPIRTVLKTRKRGDSEVIQVNLHARLTEIGTLDLWCSEVEGRGSWRLQFDVRSATETDMAAHETAAEAEGFVDESIWQQMRGAILSTFGPEGREPPEGLVKRLSEVSGSNRRDWPTSLLRRIWETLMEVEAGRRRSQVYEARWLNLLGFSLRPGYGLAVDDWRVAETWRGLQGNLIHATAMCRAEWWILWRRIAGGLAVGQQQALADSLIAPIRALHRQLVTGKGRGADFSPGSHEAAEVWRLLGSLEILPAGVKIELGNMLLDLLPKKRLEAVRPALTWALGRIGAREPVYGPLNTVIPVDTAVEWCRRLMDAAAGNEPMEHFALMELARKTDDRYRDLPEKVRGKALEWLVSHQAQAHFVELVRQGGRLDREAQGMVFGESLPKGLRIL